MSSNIAEALNAALLPARESPIVALFEFIRTMLCRWFESRRQKIEKMHGDIPEEVDKELSLNMEQSAGLPAVRVGAWTFEVNVPYKSLVDDIHKKPTWLSSISCITFPIPDPDNVDVPQYILDLPETMFPKLKRPPGRPAKKRKRSAGEYPVPEGGTAKKKKHNKCSICHKGGHNRRSCKEPLD
ncbi:unnamed protein product [Microthlaspi erraticum]|uniref:CCHC-type domain-containing protein n=1 Tax=Microthlaspi erraticum TaxID=1685480 RepID=A0A6D2IA68_9BRAS|nr:unnamed protein product [Microthlaspi erraticum]